MEHVAHMRPSALNSECMIISLWPFRSYNFSVVSRSQMAAEPLSEAVRMYLPSGLKRASVMFSALSCRKCSLCTLKVVSCTAHPDLHEAMIYELSFVNLACYTLLSILTDCITSPVAVCHRITKLSCEAVIATSEVELNPAHVIASECYSSTCEMVHLSVSQRVADPSLDEEMSSLPLGENDAQMTGLM